MAKPCAKLLFVSLEHWDDVWRRNQFLAVRLQRDFQVTFLGPQLPFWRFFCRKRRHFQQINIRYVYKFLPDRFFPRLNRWLYALQYPRKTDTLWINDHTKWFLLEAVRYRTSVYDITDDWTLVDTTAIGPDRFLCQAADTVIVCSQGLLRSRRKLTKNIILIKNGINLRDYSFRRATRKYFLYTGSLHEDRLDVSLMVALARAFPQESFIYVGPIFLQPQTCETLRRYPNIRLTGAQSYARMATYMSQAKALLVPHRQTPFVNSLDPIKQYEYMLSDVPVITTQVSGFNDWPGLFTVVPKKQFVAAVARVLHDKISVSVVLRRQAARQSTWDMRYRRLRGILCSKK